jgi:predicted nucleic acid-binding protein
LPVCAFDTNFLAYTAGIGQTPADVQKALVADAVLADALRNAIVVYPIQVCLELHNLLVRKGGRSPAGASREVADMIEGIELIDTDVEVLAAGFELAAKRRLRSCDAVILAAAARAGCDILYSEDMQHGFEWEGVRIINPFA